MTYNILDFGAYTSDRLMTREIQTAIDTCAKNGGGEVLIPEGIFRTGALRLRSHVTLHLLSGAILEGSEDWQDYCIDWEKEDREAYMKGLCEPYPVKRKAATPYSAWSNGLIRILNASDVAVIGEKYSYIDGRNVFDPKGEEGYRGPHGIAAWNVENLTLSGYTIRNTGNWAHNIAHCTNVSAKDLTVYGGHDGFDVFLCRGVSVENCRFFTGDDCIAGFGSVNVTVRNCTLHTACSAVRFGGTHVLVENCETKAPAEFAFRGSLTQEEKAGSKMPTKLARHTTKTAFLYYCDERFGKLPQNSGDIMFRNCTFTNVMQLFNMDFGQHKWCCNMPLESVTFENCTLSGMTLPIYLHGDKDVPTDFTLKDVTLSPEKGMENLIVGDIENYKTFTMENVTLNGFEHPTLLDRGGEAIRQENTALVTVEKATPGESPLKGH